MFVCFCSIGFQMLNNGSLRIHHLQVQDTGYYLCWAENIVQRTYAQIRLEVQGCFVFRKNKKKETFDFI